MDEAAGYADELSLALRVTAPAARAAIADLVARASRRGASASRGLDVGAVRDGTRCGWRRRRGMGRA